MALADRGKRIVSIVTAIAVTTLVVLLIANLSLGDKRIDTRIETLYRVSDPQFARTMSAMLGPQLLEGNHVIALRNGDEIFPAMLEAIRGARQSVTFETYIWWSGDIGRKFTEALIERARAGVRVHVTFDAVGAGKIDEDAVKQMKAAGARVEKYNPLRITNLATMNNRTHRKLLVVDGRIGFTGGVGIADEWSGNGTDPKRWRDTHFRIEGPAVAQMQAAFMENWIEGTGEVLHGPAYFPPLGAAGKQLAQMFVSSPGGGGESAQLMYLLSIAAAAKTLDIAASYFLPDEVEVRMLCDAARRGVRVRIITPGKLVDSQVVRHASRESWDELMGAGVEIYEFQPAMFHVKLMVVDALWTSAGSTNFDSRSFSVNDEANLNVLDAEFARTQLEDFEADLRRSKRITLQDLASRAWYEKLRDKAMTLMNSQL